MRYLIDTHAWLWWLTDDPRLTPRARKEMGDRANEIYLSSVSGWEIACKVRLGKMPQMAEQVHHYDALVAADGFHHLDLRYDHAVKAGLLPGRHRDPFDRLLAAQAVIEGLILVTRDPALAALGSKVIW
jgi:PIN domain nuclease of toxin-antitoxin system